MLLHVGAAATGLGHHEPAPAVGALERAEGAAVVAKYRADGHLDRVTRLDVDVLLRGYPAGQARQSGRSRTATWPSPVRA